MSLNRKHYRYSWKDGCWTLYVGLGLWLVLESKDMPEYPKRPSRRDS